MVEPESELWVPVPQLWFVGQASRPVTSLGHYGGGEFSERGPNFLNYVQHIFPGEEKDFPSGTSPLLVTASK